MNSLVIPPSPNWYATNILACSADNTIVYGSRNDLVIVTPKEENKPADVQIIPAHTEKVISVCVNPGWGNQSKLAVSAAEDQFVKLWDLENFVPVSSHRGHSTTTKKIVTAAFSGESRVISVSESGTIIIWHLGTDVLTPINNLFGNKAKITCMSVCPHYSWLVVFGLENGLLITTDLRKQGKILHRLRWHDKFIVSLSWCPVLNISLPEINYTKKNTKTEIKNKNGVCLETEIAVNVDVSNTDDIDLENSPKSSCKTTDNSKNLNETDMITVSENKTDDVSPQVAGDLEKQITEELSEILESTDITNESKNIDAVLTDKNNIQKLEQHLFLASSSKAGSVCVWKIGKTSKLYTELKPSKKSTGRVYHHESWISVCWVRPDSLLTSNKSGEFLLWNLLDVEKQKTSHLVHHDHEKVIFSIVSPIKISKEPDYGDVNLRVWTHGLDHLLLNTALGAERKNFVCLPTGSSNIQCFVPSSLDPTRIAIGYGDGNIKIWDLSRPHFQYIPMVGFWHKIIIRVMTLAWHPIKENLLAFASYDGRVGIIDTNNTSKQPTLLTHYFNNAVYKIEWGPFINDTNNLGLYASSTGSLVVYNINKPLKDPAVIIKDGYVTYFAWKSDYSILAVGTKSGSVQLYSKEMILLGTIYLLRTVHYLLWHPVGVDVEDTRDYSNWLAIAINDTTFHVYDCSPINDNIEIKPNLVASLCEHSKCVRVLAWSPHDNHKIVSGGEDGVAQVWNVTDKKLISTFKGHNYDCILTILWSPFEPYLIITGSRDNTIRIWNIVDHPPLENCDFTGMRFNYLKTFKLQSSVEVPEEDIQQTQLTKVTKTSRDVLLKSVTKLHCKDLLFNCKQLLEQSSVNNDDETVAKIDPLDLFKGYDEMMNVLKYQKHNHHIQKKSNYEQHLSLWMGDVGNSIKEAIKNDSVTPWIISLAPMISPSLWLEACESYAKKLSETVDSDPLETVSYFLACHKVEDAIQTLLKASLHIEALALAKVRLPHSINLHNEIIENWAKYCNRNGTYELAAECFIHLEQYEEAAKVLFRRSDVNSLHLALELAEKCNNCDLYNSILERYKAKNDELKPLPTRCEAVLNSMEKNCSLEDHKENN